MLEQADKVRAAQLRVDSIRSSTAAGSVQKHKEEQDALIDEALTL